MSLDWSCGELAEGLRCYRIKEFFLAHEHWESVWLKSQDPEKAFLQSLIQTAAAFHHLQRGNSVGAASLLKTALTRLEPFPATFGGIAVAPLRDEMGHWLHALDLQVTSIESPVPEIRKEFERVEQDASPSDLDS